MKVVVKEKGDTKKSFYPRLLKIKNDTAVVLFGEFGAGVCIIAGECNPIGDWSSGWSMEVFEDFAGEVILSND